jgi:hypothetical protein
MPRNKKSKKLLQIHTKGVAKAGVAECLPHTVTTLSQITPGGGLFIGRAFPLFFLLKFKSFLYVYLYFLSLFY